MFIKEEIEAKVLRLCYEAELDPTRVCVVDAAACVLWGLRHGTRYINVCVDAVYFAHLQGMSELAKLEFSPILPGDRTPSQALVLTDNITVINHLPSVKIPRVETSGGVYTTTLKDTLDRNTKQGGMIFYGDKIKLLLDSIPDVTMADLVFVRKYLSFDRYYQYSDDINVYRTGKEREAELLGLISNNERYKTLAEILNKPETINQ